MALLYCAIASKNNCVLIEYQTVICEIKSILPEILYKLEGNMKDSYDFGEKSKYIFFFNKK